MVLKIINFIKLFVETSLGVNESTLSFPILSSFNKNVACSRGTASMRRRNYFLRPSFFTIAPYARLLLVSRYFKCLRRSATRPKSPRRECLSLLFLLR